MKDEEEEERIRKCATCDYPSLKKGNIPPLLLDATWGVIFFFFFWMKLQPQIVGKRFPVSPLVLAFSLTSGDLSPCVLVVFVFSGFPSLFRRQGMSLVFPKLKNWLLFWAEWHRVSVGMGPTHNAGVNDILNGAQENFLPSVSTQSRLLFG